MNRQRAGIYGKKGIETLSPLYLIHNNLLKAWRFRENHDFSQFRCAKAVSPR